MSGRVACAIQSKEQIREANSDLSAAEAVQAVRGKRQESVPGRMAVERSCIWWQVQPSAPHCDERDLSKGCDLKERTKLGKHKPSNDQHFVRDTLLPSD